MRTPPDRIRIDQRGVAVVEFALVMPLLLVVTLAVVQVGLLARDRLLLESAARAGARAAAVESDESLVRQAVIDAAPGLESSGLTLVVTRAGGRGDPVSIALSYAAPIRVPFVDWLLGSESVRMKANTTARQEFG